MLTTSIIICCYNGQDRVSTALDSALEQTVPSDQYEVVLIDDGSTDSTREIVESYQDRHPNLRYLSHDSIQGLPAACNTGINKAKGKYVVRLDDDDRFAPDILEQIVPPMENGETDLVYTDRYDVTPDGEVRCPLGEFNLFQLVAAGTILRLDLLKQIGGYRPVFWEEYDLYLRYLQTSHLSPVHIPQPLYYYYRRPGSLSLTASPDRVRAGWEELESIWGETTLKKFGWNGDTGYLPEVGSN